MGAQTSGPRPPFGAGPRASGVLASLEARGTRHLRVGLRQAWAASDIGRGCCTSGSECLAASALRASPCLPRIPPKKPVSHASNIS